MSAYTSLGALKAAVGLKSEDTADDNILTTLIWRASAKVDSFLDQHRIGYVGFAASSNSRSSVGSNTRRYDGTGHDTLFIDDATSVASVTVDDTAITSTAYSSWPYNETPKRALIYESPTSSLHGLTSAVWSRGTGNVEVTGYFGLDHVPSDVEQTTLALAIVYWRRYQQGEPEPVVTPRGSRGFVVSDPEVEGILVSGLSGWVNAGVWGG